MTPHPAVSTPPATAAAVTKITGPLCHCPLGEPCGLARSLSCKLRRASKTHDRAAADEFREAIAEHREEARRRWDALTREGDRKTQKTFAEVHH
jgi:hypothetical protein